MRIYIGNTGHIKKSSKFFALRVTPPAHPEPALAPKWPKMAASWHHLGFKNRPKMGYPIGLWGQKWGTPSVPGTKNSKQIDLKKQRDKKKGGLPQIPPI